jgi:transcriptional regulator with PAS, ATPase and Fis domain
MLAGVDTPVLLQGETGVGKEVFARAIHESGRTAAGPFVPLNCGGLPRELLASELFGYVGGAFTGARRAGVVGKLEAAHLGTLFLDEIGELPLELQPFLLRVLEGGEIYPVGATQPRRSSFRLITATNRTLVDDVSAGRFRMDLYYRISGTCLRVPPLREHLDDLPELVEHFAEAVAVRNCTARKCFAADVLAAFARYSWPGNVRELRNVVEEMTLLGGPGTRVGLEALPREISEPRSPSDRPSAPPTPRRLEEIERDAIETTLREYEGNMTEVARALQVSRSTLYVKLRKYGLESILAQIRRGPAGSPVRR